LKRVVEIGCAALAAASPGSDAGCGLKPRARFVGVLAAKHHPAAMPGAD